VLEQKGSEYLSGGGSAGEKREPRFSFSKKKGVAVRELKNKKKKKETTEQGVLEARVEEKENRRRGSAAA